MQTFASNQLQIKGNLPSRSRLFHLLPRFKNASLLPGSCRVNRSLIKAVTDLLKTRLPGVGMQELERRKRRRGAGFLVPALGNPNVTFWEVKPLFPSQTPWSPSWLPAPRFRWKFRERERGPTEVVKEDEEPLI